MINNHISIGILAHVDAGKTTLAEGLLYKTGMIKKPGRVDHRDAFLDTDEQERSRGITIFSKQARINTEKKKYTLLDTPGHVDFSAEMERTLQVLDYAILIVSASDGIQGHDMTLWKLLRQYKIPVFIFVNKMDMPGTEKAAIIKELQLHFDSNCVDFSNKQNEEVFFDNLAMCDESMMQEYLDTGCINEDIICVHIKKRHVFPCFFGSALKMDGIDDFIQGLDQYTIVSEYPEEFGARVYKITRDAQGNRLTHMKITGGCLRVKMPLTVKGQDEEKINQIRLYSGVNYQTEETASAGMICTVTGLQNSTAGMGYGFESEAELPILEPVLAYQMMLPDESDVHGCYLKLSQLEEEEPQLHIVWNEKTQEITARVMGEVQIDVLKRIIKDRFNLNIEFGPGTITYKETIAEPVEGVGHFEPLRHYAEVHLLLEPLERGSGLEFAADCSEDILDKNWQRLILTHLEEKKHLGVLTGSEITDMKVTLITGKAHLKHTEGGDFRQATYRAVRQGLRSGESILLEPIYSFILEVPSENIGRAMTDITRMCGEFQPPEINAEMAVLTGTAPVSEMQEYQKEVISYTRGRGRLFCSLKGYEKCHDPEAVISRMQYDPEADLDNPTGSVFCAHGAGFVVPWDQVPEYMHLEGRICRSKEEAAEEYTYYKKPVSAVFAPSGGWGDDKDLEEIFKRTYGAGREERTGWNRSRTDSGPRTVAGSVSRNRLEKKENLQEYLLVDGYNVIFAIQQLQELAEINIDSARTKLMDLLCNYQGYKNHTVILVYDAYKVEGGKGSIQKYHNIYVVYTKEAETADQYIEKTVHEIGKKYHVTVATSDALEQRIIWGAGASRMSAKGLWEELALVRKEIAESYLQKNTASGRLLFQNLDEEMAEYLEKIRLGKQPDDQ